MLLLQKIGSLTREPLIILPMILAFFLMSSPILVQIKSSSVMVFLFLFRTQVIKSPLIHPISFVYEKFFLFLSFPLISLVFLDFVMITMFSLSFMPLIFLSRTKFPRGHCFRATLKMVCTLPLLLHSTVPLFPTVLNHLLLSHQFSMPDLGIRLLQYFIKLFLLVIQQCIFLLIKKMLIRVHIVHLLKHINYLLHCLLHVLLFLWN